MPVIDDIRLYVIIPAAGSSARFNAAGAGPGLLGQPRSKLDEDLGGRPVLQRAVELFTSRPDVAGVIVAGPQADAPFAEFELRHGDRLAMLGASVCRGGRHHRWESVRAALAMVPADATHVAVHDAARPVTRQDLIDRVFDAVTRHPAVIPAVDVSDTLKRVSNRGEAPAQADPLAAILSGGAGHSGADLRRVEATVDRANLVAVQTPQAFEAGLLRRAYESPDEHGTDEAGQVERLGEPVTVVLGDPRNIKITVPTDVELARLIGGFPPPTERAVHKRF